MHSFLFLLSILSGLSFVVYGFSCLLSDHMRAEFARFGLARYRVMVGGLELLGGSAQLASLFFPLLGAWAAGGLALLMGLGVMTRIRIGDGWVKTLPAIGYMLMNAFLLVALLTP